MTARAKQGMSWFSLGVFVITFIIVYCSQIVWPSLPSIRTFSLIVFALTAIAFFCKNVSALLGALFGFIWSASVGYWYLHWQPQDIQFQQDVLIIGQITDVALVEDKMRLQVSATRIGEKAFWIQRRIRLNWYQPSTSLKEGDMVSLTAKLKPVYGLANPYSFDYERWLLSKNIVALGYVASKAIEIKTPTKSAVRSRLIEKLKSYQLSQKRWLLSLAFGDRHGLSPLDWDVLQVSGLSHLFAISGLHLGILAGILLGFSHLFPRVLGFIGVQLACFQKMPQINLKPMIIIAIILICAGYAYLASWQIPVVRALVMLTLALSFVTLRIRLNLWQLLGLVFVVFILFMPFSIYSNSFWLSITAVSIIAFYIWRWPSISNIGDSYLTRSLKSLVRLQLVLSALMAPFIVSQFGFVSVLAIGLNLLAVPFITILIVPLCLIAVALMLLNLPFDCYVLTLANSLIEYFFTFIRFVTSDEFLVWRNISISAVPLMLMFFGLLLSFMPRFVCQYRIVLLLLMPAITELISPESFTDGWRIHVLDVGQGTSIAITQGNRVVLVDTGAKFKSGFSMGEAVVLPFLAGNRLNAIDHFIISHNDNDHAGSAEIIKRRVNINNLIDPDNCQQGQRFEWERLSVYVLWPTEVERQLAKLNENNLSCVVKISDGYRSVLLSGDIERVAEERLVRSLKDNTDLTLNAEILIAPHHGSKTSSSLLFLKRVEPDHSVYTTAYLNRWRFPHTDVTRRHKRLDIEQWNTAIHGYTRFTVPYDQQHSIIAETWRNDLNKRWYGRRTKN